MKISTSKFLLSAPDLEGCPKPTKPEFAFIGRSNVGKSSLVNMLTGKKDLAKVSGTPGKTRLINFFSMNNAWRLVDLPGYGYAKVGKKEQAGFNDAVGSYVAQRENLKRTFILIDSRAEPMEIDMEYLHWVKSVGIPYALIFTKTDKISDSQRRDNIDLFLQNLTAWDIELPPVLSCSSKTKKGRGEILSFIGKSLPKSAMVKNKSGISLGWLNKGKR